MSNTPETDRQWANWLQELKNPIESFVNFARKLERERDEANKELHKQLAKYDALFDEAEKIRVERDKALETFADWENAAEHVKADHPDEVHCGCVKVLRKLLSDALRERDEAREAFAVATGQLVQAQEVLRERLQDD
jgi:vacuolar-type H+-ATPase subunit I/STV1